MASNLLAEFDSFYNPASTVPSNAGVALNDLSLLNEENVPPQQDQQLSSQSFSGSFGTLRFPVEADKNPEPNSLGNGVHGTSPSRSDANEDTAKFQRPSQTRPLPGIVRASTIELFSSNIADLAESSHEAAQASSWSESTSQVSSKNAFSGVLFDADDMSSDHVDDDEDEFGEFETGTISNALLDSSKPSEDLSTRLSATKLEPALNKRQQPLESPSEGLTSTSLFYPHVLQSSSFQDRTPCNDVGLATSVAGNTKRLTCLPFVSPIKAWGENSPNSCEEFPREWEDFSDLPPEASNAYEVQSKNTTQISGTSWDTNPALKNEGRSKLSTTNPNIWAWDTFEEPITTTVAPPPSNIPPPSTLLSLFTHLFELPHTSLFQPVAGQTPTVKQRILMDPSTIKFLQGSLLIAVVAARILAGRKVRWKRDTRLAQTMKIGPSAVGGRGGMKLTGVDKVEILKEDREAAEVVRIWKKHLGRLRSAIAVANSGLQDGAACLVVPEIEDAMLIKIQAGAMTAPKPCIICGLKREERIYKIDQQVEDSFSEWWTEHWGHNACRNFWLEHEPELRDR